MESSDDGHGSERNILTSSITEDVCSPSLAVVSDALSKELDSNPLFI